MRKLTGNCFFGCQIKDNAKRFSGNVFKINGILCYHHYRNEYRVVQERVPLKNQFSIQTTVSSVSDYYKNKNNPELLRKLKLSEETDKICFEILNRNYKVDIDNGEVISLKTNNKINGFCRGSKYLFVRLYFEGKRISIRLHRAIGMFKFGVEAIIGKEIGHKDKNPTNNRGDNLELYNSRKEHLEKDGIGPGKNGMEGVRTEWSVCIKCGIKDGYIAKERESPLRFNGLPYGFNGELCGKCYRVIRHRVSKGLKPVPDPVIIGPCGLCGDSGGYTSVGCKRPSRLNGERFGFKDKLCHTCFNRLNHQFKNKGIN